MRYLTAISLAVVVLFAVGCVGEDDKVTPAPKLAATQISATERYPCGLFTECAYTKAIAGAYRLRAWWYKDKGEHQNAIADFTKAIELAPDAETYGWRGLSYAALSEHQNAIADYTKAIQLDPEHGAHYLRRGDVYQILGLHSLADVDFAKACSLNSNLCD